MSLPLRTVLACSLCSGLSLCFLPLPCALAGTSSLMTQPTLTGNWGGQRQKLEEQGIKLTGDYTSETLSCGFHGHLATHSMSI